MAKFYSELDDNLRSFIAAQKLFFVATAPDAGRISLSPKGLDSLRVLDNKRVAYLDLTGSGNETAAHLLQNGRMTLMFCAFAGEPLILRLYGRGRTVHQDEPEWDALLACFPPYPGIRQIMVLDIDSLQTSCGAGVPLFDYQGERDKLLRWAEKKGDDGIRAYWEEKNRTSIDGLPTGLLKD
ncbi:MAG: pyridoxamine 5'-phosphate oxidase family protein [Sulfuricellaceae bacterium]|jgi:hypothetical protein